jgi:hypothetical protein
MAMCREIKSPTNNSSDKAAAAVRAQQLNGEIKTHLIDDAIDALGGVYPGLDIGVDLGLLCVSLQSGSGYGTSSSASMPLDGIICTRAEFESRKAERQGKPNWKDAPSWANWLGQCLNGYWEWYQRKPSANGKCFDHGRDRGSRAGAKGEVIGNWQDTLEQRPEVKSTNSQMSLKEYHAHVRQCVNAWGDNVCATLFPEVKKPEPVGAENRGITRTEFMACRSVPVDVKIDNYIWNAPRTEPEPVGYSEFEKTAIAICPAFEGKIFAAKMQAALKEIKESEPAKADWYDYESQQATPTFPSQICGKKLEVLFDEQWQAATILHVAKRAAHVEFELGGEALIGLNEVAFRPLDWDRLSPNPNPEPEPSPELSFHLANASNELQASAKLLKPESHLLQSITGVIGAIQAIREAV